MERLKGIGVCPGVAIGPALVAIQRTHVIRFLVPPERVGEELVALERARTRSREQLQQIRARIATIRGSDLASIFDAQLLILDDPMLVDRAATLVREERENAGWAIQHTFDELASVLDEVKDPYLRERKGDLHDLAGRLRMNLRNATGGLRDLLRDLTVPCVLIADELTPSVVAQLDWTRVRGFATDAGSRTYHTAIVARSLGVPAVVGLRDVSLRVSPGATVIVDGENSEVIIAPDATAREQAERHGPTARGRAFLRTPAPGPVDTDDGVRVTLEANVERPEDAAAALAAGAEGIGLYRFEFLLAGGSPALVDEEAQFEAYRELLTGMAGGPVTIRTFDIDERQIARSLGSGLDAWFEEDRPTTGPAGRRGISLGLAYPAMLRTQVRALFRAAQHGPLRMLFPFVSSLDEVRAARQIVNDVRAELTAAGATVPRVPIGIMIELPAAAFITSTLAREVDFLTIGTNDLIQYMLGVDRTDGSVTDRYEPLHPAVLRLIRHVRRTAGHRGVPVSLCGEMASDPLLLELLIGCGLTSFSMAAGALAGARRVVSETKAGEMARVAARALRLGTVRDIEQFLLETFERRERMSTVDSRL